MLGEYGFMNLLNLISCFDTWVVSIPISGWRVFQSYENGKMKKK